MEKKPFYFNAEKQKLEIEKLNSVKALFQSLIKKYKEVEGLPELLQEDFINLFNSPKTLVAEKLIEKHNIKFEGDLKIKTSKVFELFDEPVGLAELIEHHKTFLSEISEVLREGNNTGHYLMSVSPSDFELVNGNVEIKKEALEAIENSCSFYLKTEKQKKVYDSMKILKTELDKLRDEFGGRLDIKDFYYKAFGVHPVQHLNHETAELKINHEFVLSLS